MKLLIQEQFYGGVHHVWCAECWDSRKQAGNAALVPPSSNPCEIYSSLGEAVRRGDRHNAHIARVRAGYLERGATQVAAGTLTEDQLAEMTLLLTTTDLREWRPMLYLVHRELVEPQLVSVPFADRAGLGPEWVVPSLQSGQFDLVEF